MDELISTITEKTGISEEQAQNAADITINFIKDKLPAGMGDKLEGMISGEGGGAAGMMGKLGGFMKS